MRKLARLALSAVAASLLLAATTDVASARNFSASNQNFRVTWTSLEFVLFEVVVRCPVTIEGSYHARSIAKVVNSLVGAITKGIVKQESCSGGTIATFNGTERYNGGTPSNTLPWHEQYAGFAGTLPRFTARKDAISRFRLGVRDSSGVCVGQYGTSEDSLHVEASVGAGGAMTTFALTEGSNSITLVRRDGGIICPSPARLRGTGNITVQCTTTRITLSLI